MLKESIKNKDKLIPDDYENRLKSLLDSLPDELPVSDSTEVEVIKKASHFNIRPLVSAAAVFAVAAAGILTLKNNAGNSLGSGHEHGGVYVTTSVSETTPEVTTEVTETEAVSEITAVSEPSYEEIGSEENYVIEPTENPDNKTDNVISEIIPVVSAVNPEVKPSESPVPEQPSVPVPEDPAEPEKPLDNPESPDEGPAAEHPHPGANAGPKHEEDKKDKDKDKNKDRDEDNVQDEPFNPGLAYGPEPVRPGLAGGLSPENHGFADTFADTEEPVYPGLSEDEENSYSDILW